jgi:hypothetical protein
MKSDLETNAIEAAAKQMISELRRKKMLAPGRTEAWLTKYINERRALFKSHSRASSILSEHPQTTRGKLRDAVRLINKLRPIVSWHAMTPSSSENDRKVVPLLDALRDQYSFEANNLNVSGHGRPSKRESDSGWTARAIKKSTWMTVLLGELFVPKATVRATTRKGRDVQNARNRAIAEMNTKCRDLIVAQVIA